ncbi:MAG: alpha/beta hydrolase [Muribaculaceae bacterium]|nr:alpha/beta hydrolase [Muribaculaceae bacterium]
MKKMLCGLSLLAMTALNVQSKMIEIDLWPEGAPNTNELTGPEGMAGVCVNNVSHPVLYVYPAAKPNGTAIVMCPGGAYAGLAMAHEGTDMADWLNAQGVTLAVLKYRMPNGHDDVPLADAEQAMRIMRTQGAEWGVNPNSVGIAGASAGGHLATTLATHYSGAETRPDFQVLFYPVVTTEKGVTHQGSVDNLCGQTPTEEQLRKFSNELQVTPETPKAFIMVSADDGAVPVTNSLRYFDALTRNGVISTLHVYPTGGHGWGYYDSFPYKDLWKGELEEWLRREVVK